MGNGLRKAIDEENWDEVRSLMKRPGVKERVRNKTYTTHRYIGSNFKKGAQEQVKCLHLLLQQPVPLDVVSDVLAFDRQQLRALSEPTKELPLHFALLHPSRAPRAEVFELILEMYPQALKTQSATGKTPLHIACEAMQPVRVIKQLVMEDPETIFIKDKSGRFPWDLVVKKSKGIRKVLYRWRLRGILYPLARPEQSQQDTPAVQTHTPFERFQQEPTAERPQQATPVEQNHTPPDQFQQNPQVEQTDIPFVKVERVFPPEESVHHSSNMSPEEQQAASSTGLCVLCWGATANCALIPCGHICLCAVCSDQHLNYLGQKCPICKSTFERKVKTYPAGIPEEL